MSKFSGIAILLETFCPHNLGLPGHTHTLTEAACDSVDDSCRCQRWRVCWWTWAQTLVDGAQVQQAIRTQTPHR